jgi:hypothetical protein
MRTVTDRERRARLARRHGLAPAHRYADVAAEAVRALNHATIIRRPAVPAPDLYPVLGSLARTAHGLAQAAQQIAAHLGDSVHTYDVHQDDESDPLAATEAGMAHLMCAAQCARQLGRTFEGAQSAIAIQGYVPRPEGGVTVSTAPDSTDGSDATPYAHVGGQRDCHGVDDTTVPLADETSVSGPSASVGQEAMR